MDKPLDLRAVEALNNLPAPYRYCPFCGGKARLTEPTIDCRHWSIQCLHCGARVTGIGDDSSEVKTKWNRRAIDVTALVAALRETRAALTDGPPLITSLNGIRPDASGGPAKMVAWFAAAFAWSERAAAVLASVTDGPEAG